MDGCEPRYHSLIALVGLGVRGFHEFHGRDGPARQFHGYGCEYDGPTRHLHGHGHGREYDGPVMHLHGHGREWPYKAWRKGLSLTNGTVQCEHSVHGMTLGLEIIQDAS